MSEEKLYAEEFAVDREFGLKQMFGDKRCFGGTHTGSQCGDKSAQARLYYVDFIDSRSKEWSGTPHSADGYFLWSGETSGDEQVADLSKRLQAYWANFAGTGDPNGKGLTAWPEYDAESDQWMVFGLADNVQQGVAKERLDFRSPLHEPHRRSRVNAGVGLAKFSGG